MTDTLRLAIILNPDLPPGLLANTAGAIGIGLAAKFPMLAGNSLTDAKGATIDVSSKYPVPILQGTTDHIKALMFKALDAGGERTRLDGWRQTTAHHVAGQFTERAAQRGA